METAFSPTTPRKLKSSDCVAQTYSSNLSEQFYRNINTTFKAALGYMKKPCVVGLTPAKVARPNDKKARLLINFGSGTSKSRVRCRHSSPTSRQSVKPLFQHIAEFRTHHSVALQRPETPPHCSRPPSRRQAR